MIKEKSHLHSGRPDHRKPCMEGKRHQAGSYTSGNLLLPDGRCPHTLYLKQTKEKALTSVEHPSHSGHDSLKCLSSQQVASL